jgi:hypothetical protein
VTGRPCPYDEHAPRTIDGLQAWDVFGRCARQVRTVGMGQPVGIDLSVALAIARAEGADARAMATLLPAIEGGAFGAEKPDIPVRPEDVREGLSALKELGKAAG